MTVYKGDRTIDGVLVTADGEQLDEHIDAHCYSQDFEWSYEGPAPSQLAFALLVDHLRDIPQAEALQDRFMRAVVANFQNEWEMSSEDVDRVLKSFK
jgi:hypothetical protein